MNYETGEEHFPIYGIFQNSFGQLRYDNTKDYIENEINKEELKGIGSEYVSKDISINKSLRNLESNTQGIRGVNTKLLEKEGRTVGGMFKVKQRPKTYVSKYF